MLSLVNSQHCTLRTSNLGVRVNNTFNAVSLRFILKRSSSSFNFDLGRSGSKYGIPDDPMLHALRSSFSREVSWESDLHASAVIDVS